MASTTCPVQNDDALDDVEPHERRKSGDGGRLAVTVGTVVTGRSCARSDVVGGAAGGVVTTDEGGDERGARLCAGGIVVAVLTGTGAVVAGATGTAPGTRGAGTVEGGGPGALGVDDAMNSPASWVRLATWISAPELAPVTRYTASATLPRMTTDPETNLHAIRTSDSASPPDSLGPLCELDNAAPSYPWLGIIMGVAPHRDRDNANVHLAVAIRSHPVHATVATKDLPRPERSGTAPVERLDRRPHPMGGPTSAMRFL
jgi:hypothetical protein